MPSTAVACALMMVSATILPAAYSNLIATSDGNTVYFQALGFGSARWYVIRAAGSNPTIEALNDSLADASGSGQVFASADYSERYCGFAGSTCFTASPCAASFSILGPGINVRGYDRPTFIRLDRGGALVWIDQQGGCWGMRSPPSQLNGLYESHSLRQVAPANGATLANQRYGRRVITDRGQALTFAGIQLSWLDAAGSHPIRHVARAFEAVTDTAGSNIVYVESPAGKLHWIADEDQDLGLTGSAPALSDDGRTLAFLAPDGSMQVYDRALRSVRALGSDTYLSFTLGGKDVFAVTSGNSLVRINLVNGTASELLSAFPEIQSADAPPAGIPWLCPLVCYGTPDPGLLLGRGMILVFRGRNLDQAGWRARFTSLGSTGANAVGIPINALSGTAAWFQVPSDLVGNGQLLVQDLDIYNPERPFRFGARVGVQDRVMACLGTLHQDFGRSVSTDDPAAPGEIVHVFMTGLRGVEPIPDGAPNPADRLIAVANPPALAAPDAIEPVFFGLAPGFVGIQQLDLRVLRAPSNQQSSLFSNINAFGCASPPVATP